MLFGYNKNIVNVNGTLNNETANTTNYNFFESFGYSGSSNSIRLQTNYQGLGLPWYIFN